MSESVQQILFCVSTILVFNPATHIFPKHFQASIPPCKIGARDSGALKSASVNNLLKAEMLLQKCHFFIEKYKFFVCSVKFSFSTFTTIKIVFKMESG